MILISSRFSDASFLDFALGEIQKEIIIKNVLIKGFGDETELPVNYPMNPDYNNTDQNQYLEGMPHILSNGPVYAGFYEPGENTEARLAFFTDEENEKTAKKIILKYGGYNIKVGY